MFWRPQLGRIRFSLTHNSHVKSNRKRGRIESQTVTDLRAGKHTEPQSHNMVVTPIPTIRLYKNHFLYLHLKTRFCFRNLQNWRQRPFAYWIHSIAANIILLRQCTKFFVKENDILYEKIYYVSYKQNVLKHIDFANVFGRHNVFQSDWSYFRSIIACILFRDIFESSSKTAMICLWQTKQYFSVKILYLIQTLTK